MKFFSKKSVVDTDSKKIEEILSRSVSSVLPSREALATALSSGKRLRFYIGADATGPSLHIGHATNFMVLEKMRRLGHEVIVLFGDFTAMIGDPSGKDSARKQLSPKEVADNIRSWKDQVSKIVSFSGSNPARIERNSKWLGKLSFGDVIDLSSQFTVQQMLERDMFDKRMKENKPIFLHEFMYPLMQGYDSVAMDVDVEIGGNDQTFNMLAGRTLQKSINGKNKFVIATTLLVNQKTGKKLMNKSEGGYIALNDSPDEMFGKTMALPDEVILSVYTDCTYLSNEEIEKERKFILGGGNPRDAKIRLAQALVSIYHGDAAAARAQESFVGAFSTGAMPSDAPEASVAADALLVDVLLGAKLVSSKTDFRRLVSEGAIKDLKGQGAIKAFDAKVTSDMDLKIGKHRFLKISLK
ncbi:MAG: tyrosine--tRNA ligase [Candidatus Paceibacterota bacterium]|jgi:tyrosyl-tRNA synthetase